MLLRRYEQPRCVFWSLLLNFVLCKWLPTMCHAPNYFTLCNWLRGCQGKSTVTILGMSMYCQWKTHPHRGPKFLKPCFQRLSLPLSTLLSEHSDLQELLVSLSPDKDQVKAHGEVKGPWCPQLAAPLETLLVGQPVLRPTAAKGLGFCQHCSVTS